MRSGESAEDRVRRIVSLLFGVAALVFGLIGLGAVLSQLGIAPGWWTAAALVAVLGTSAVLGVAAPFAPLALLQTLAAAVAVGYALVAVSMPFAVSPSATAGAAPWPLGLTAIATTATALAFQPAVAWASTLALGVSVAVDRVTTARGDLLAIAVQDAAYATFFAAVFVGLTLGALAAGRRVDAAAEDADRTAVAAARERVQQDERSRVDALVHDRVLATLLLAARRIPGTDGAVQQQSTAALAALRDLRDDVPGPAQLTWAQLADRVRSQITQTAPWAEFEEPAVGPSVPGAVAEALIGAVGEALRNAAQHGGADAAAAVRMEPDGVGVLLTVVDGGSGFDPAAVAPGRLGIASSIVGRLRSVGGDAVVRSRPGAGTAVQLRWAPR